MNLPYRDTESYTELFPTQFRLCWNIKKTLFLTVRGTADATTKNSFKISVFAESTLVYSAVSQKAVIQHQSALGDNIRADRDNSSSAVVLDTADKKTKITLKISGLWDCWCSVKGGDIGQYRFSPWIKGTVSPDITFYFRFCKIKSVLSVRPLRVLKFFYFVVL
jgi:hypothetical protein